MVRCRMMQSSAFLEIKILLLLFWSLGDNPDLIQVDVMIPIDLKSQKTSGNQSSVYPQMGVKSVFWDLIFFLREKKYI